MFLISSTPNGSLNFCFKQSHLMKPSINLPNLNIQDGWNQFHLSHRPKKMPENYRTQYPQPLSCLGRLKIHFPDTFASSTFSNLTRKKAVPEDSTYDQTKKQRKKECSETASIPISKLLLDHKGDCISLAMISHFNKFVI